MRMGTGLIVVFCAGLPTGSALAQTCDGLLAPGQQHTAVRSRFARSSIQEEVQIGANWVHQSGVFAAGTFGRTGYSDGTQREIVGGRFVFEATVGWQLIRFANLYACPLVGVHEEFGPAQPPGVQDFEVRRWRTELAVANPLRLAHQVRVVPGGSLGVTHRREWDTETVFRVGFGNPGDPPILTDGETRSSTFQRTWLVVAGRLGLEVARRVAIRFEYRAPLTQRARVRAVTSVEVALGIW